MIFEIKNYLWEKNGYKPKTYFDITLNNNIINVCIKSYETNIKYSQKGNRALVHNDSCVEMFCNFSPQNSEEYINFEFNPIGANHIAIGEGRMGRSFISDDDVEKLNIKASIQKDFWQIEFQITETFLNRYYNDINIKPGMKVKANFYKCGDKTDFPHYGCWNEVKSAVPDFHRPEYFKYVIL